MQITCKCLNIVIVYKAIIEDYNLKSKGILADHWFFKEVDIGCVDLESIHKEQSCLVAVENCGEWVIHQCLNCHLYTHALNTTSTAVVLINRALLVKDEDILSLKNSAKYSPVFRIVIDYIEEDESKSVSGARVDGSAALQAQLTEWIQRESSQTEERVRQYTDQQYAQLEQLRARAHRDHLALTKTLLEAAQKSAPSSMEVKKPVSQFLNVTNSKPSSPQRAIPVLPDPTSAIATQHVANRPRNLARKPSVDAEGLFDLDEMAAPVETFPSDEEQTAEELSDTDESGSHDEGIHIPRHVVSSSVYGRSLPVNVPICPKNKESPERHDDREIPEEPNMDIAASIKALAKSVHGDAVFGDLPRPRFSSQI